jgi:hypothetical protein
MLENSHNPMEAYGQMRDPNRLDHCEDHSSLDQVARRVMAMRLVRLYLEVDQVARMLFERGG